MKNDLTSPERFALLVREHQGMVFRTLTRLTGAGAQVEDLAQEVFLRLYRALPEFRGEAAISTYLYRIVVNVAQDEWNGGAGSGAGLCTSLRSRTKVAAGWRASPAMN